MKSTFEKQKFNAAVINKEDYVKQFATLGFEAKKVEICLTNGCSAYITLDVKVLNENKMYAECFVFEGKSRITIRVSNHESNLEKICCGVSGNRLSFQAFKTLVDRNIICQA